MSHKYTREQVINKIVEKFGPDAFSFDKMIYIRNDKKIILGCNKCNNDFSIQPVKLFMGTACQICARAIRDKKCSLTNEEFIKLSKEKYGNKFDYSLCNYTLIKNYITLKCNDCNTIFDTKAYYHMGKNSDGCCKVCQTKKSKAAQTKTTEQFIIEAKLIYGNKYDYKLVNYTGAFNKIIVRCNDCCEEFKIRPSAHLNKSGCTLCSDKTHTNKFVSKSETKWLDELNIPIEYRQKRLKIKDKRFIADAYDPIKNIVYEFYGDYWHGNPNIYDINKINFKNGFTFGELYNKTIERENILKNNGFKIIKIWEQNWRIIKRFEKKQIKLEQLKVVA